MNEKAKAFCVCCTWLFNCTSRWDVCFQLDSVSESENMVKLAPSLSHFPSKIPCNPPILTKNMIFLNLAYLLSHFLIFGWWPVNNVFVLCWCHNQLELWVQSQKIPKSPTMIYLPWIISLELSPLMFCTVIIFLYAHSQVLHNNCVKFKFYRFICLGEVGLTINMDGQTGWFLYTPWKNLFAGFIQMREMKAWFNIPFWNFCKADFVVWSIKAKSVSHFLFTKHSCKQWSVNALQYTN